MRVLVDIRHLSTEQPSGVGEYTIQLLRALFEIDQKNEYVLLSSGLVKPFSHPEEAQTLGSFADAQDDKIKFFHLSQPNKLLNLRTLLLGHPTLNWHIREPIDLIFLPNLAITALPDSIPTVVTVHDLSWKFFPEFYSHKMRLWHKATRPDKLISLAKKIIVPSESTGIDLQNEFAVNPKKIHPIAHGTNQSFSPRMEARDHGVRSRYKLPKQFALFVGTLEPRKNVLGLIEGIKQYRIRSREDLHLVLVGKWGWKSTQLRHRLCKRDVNSWVHHIGYVHTQDRPALYRSASVFTWPSIYEGFGLPVLEAMASGTPVITSRNSSIPELAGNASILIDPYNPTDISEALSQLLPSTALQQRLKERGLARAAEFSWEKTAKATLSIFEHTHSS